MSRSDGSWTEHMQMQKLLLYCPSSLSEVLGRHRLTYSLLLPGTASSTLGSPAGGSSAEVPSYTDTSNVAIQDKLATLHDEINELKSLVQEIHDPLGSTTELDRSKEDLVGGQSPKLPNRLSKKERDNRKEDAAKHNEVKDKQRRKGGDVVKEKTQSRSQAS